MLVKKKSYLALPILCHALSVNATERLPGIGANELGRKLTGYEPSYFSAAFDDEDNHFEFSVSVKYPMDEDVEWLRRIFGGEAGDIKAYFAYTGAYDFFLLSDENGPRASAPVVSRLQNPGLFYKREFFDYADADQGLMSLAVGWFHESNGQQIDGDNNALFNSLDPLIRSDYVSRGWDYLGIDLKYHYDDLAGYGEDLDFYTRLRAFCDCQGFGAIDGREDDVTVFTGRNDHDIGDFDGLRLIVNHRLSPRFTYSLHYRTGLRDNNAFRHSSWRYQVTFKSSWKWIKDIPWNIFYFDGYGSNISTYHIKDSYLGIGIQMW